jgi:hypothetical protein
VVRATTVVPMVAPMAERLRVATAVLTAVPVRATAVPMVALTAVPMVVLTAVPTVVLTAVPMVARTAVPAAEHG